MFCSHPCFSPSSRPRFDYLPRQHQSYGSRSTFSELSASPKYTILGPKPETVTETLSSWHCQYYGFLLFIFDFILSYLLNPYQLLPSLARSTASIENAISLLASAFACSGISSSLQVSNVPQFDPGKSSYALLALAFLTHLSMPAVLLTLPISLLILRGPHSSLATPTAFHSWSKLIPLIAEYSIYVGILSITASSIAGGVHWSYKTWGALYVTYSSPACQNS